MSLVIIPNYSYDIIYNLFKNLSKVNNVHNYIHKHKIYNQMKYLHSKYSTE